MFAMQLRTIVQRWGTLLGLLLPSMAWANIGPRWHGDRTAEPLGLKGVAILREKLTIDLRPLADVQPVEVEAIYHLNNSGSANKLDLLFVTGLTGVSDFEVRLDGRLVASRRVPPKEQSRRHDELPKSWQPPDDLPVIDFESSRSHVYRLLGDPILLTFVLELPPGRSTLSARYRARAYVDDEDYPTVTWLFPYILAPAREWESFGGLDVTVYLPDTWQSNSKPALEREGRVMRGSFTTLPADCLALAVRMPMGPEMQQKLRNTIWMCVALYVFVVIGGGILCWWTGRSLGRFLVRMTPPGRIVANKPPLWVKPFPFLMTVGGAAAIFGTLALARHSILGVFAGQEHPYFHEHFLLPFLANVCFNLFVLPVGFLLTRNGVLRSLQDAAKRWHTANGVR
jgi:hypothetical protein